MCVKLYMNRKALSPIIGVILIILVAVILITTFLVWSKEYYNNQLNKNTDQLKKATNIECANSKLKIDSCIFDNETKILSLLLINDSEIRYFDVTLTIEGESISGEKIRQYGVFKEILTPGDSVYLSTDNNFTILDSFGVYEDIDLTKISLVNLTSGACRQQNYVLTCSVN